jgi:hypothetical protein
MVRTTRPAVALAAAALLLVAPLPSSATLSAGPASPGLSSAGVSGTTPPAAVVAVVALQMSADIGHGEKVSRAASAPGGPIVPEGCRNFGHWVSSEARGTTCEDSPRPGGPQDARPKDRKDARPGGSQD